jgi:hypothetical protein
LNKIKTEYNDNMISESHYMKIKLKHEKKIDKIKDQIRDFESKL